MNITIREALGQAKRLRNNEYREEIIQKIKTKIRAKKIFDVEYETVEDNFERWIYYVSDTKFGYIWNNLKTGEIYYSKPTTSTKAIEKIKL